MSSITLLLRNILLKAFPIFTGCSLCADDKIPWREMRRRLPDPDFPVDFVFTWVDNADPELAAKHARHLPESKRRGAEGQETSHFRDNDELRYALRSLEAYAPWARRIFIVTDAQRPSWLRTDNPKVRVVDHTECIPHEYLPTFNSRVIEAHLHHIPGLAEHFVYCNDDFFLLAPCRKSDFFTANGLPYTFIDWRQSRRQGYAATTTPHSASHANARAWMAQKGVSPIPDFITAHVHYPLTKDNMRSAYAFYAEIVKNSGANKVRTTSEIVFPCHAAPLWAYAMKRTVPRDMPYCYINSKRFDRNTYYAAMLREKDQESLPPFLCINDVGDAPEGHAWKRDMRRFLETFYPKPSSFEISFRRSHDGQRAV